MFWKRKPSVSEDMAAWIEDSFDWAADTFGTNWQNSRRLIWPDPETFTAPKGNTPPIAQWIANDISNLIPVETVKVEPLERIPSEYQHNYQDLGDISAHYDPSADQPIIRYNPELMSRPIPFISTITHELMHHRLAPYVEVMPGGAEAHELSTDLHCITHGFGLFQLESAAQLGWSGYMTQESRCYALAVFLRRNRIEPDDALKRLNPRSAKALRRAVSEVFV